MDDVCADIVEEALVVRDNKQGLLPVLEVTIDENKITHRSANYLQVKLKNQKRNINHKIYEAFARIIYNEPKLQHKNMKNTTTKKK